MVLQREILKRGVAALSKRKPARGKRGGRGGPSKGSFNSVFNAVVGPPGKGKNWYDLAKLKTDSGRRIRDYLSSFDDDIDEGE